MSLYIKGTANIIFSSDNLSKKIIINEDQALCFGCAKILKLGEIVYLCSIDKTVTCLTCAISKEYFCKSRLVKDEHLDFRGILTKKEVQN